MSVEQMCRDLLAVAIADGLVSERREVGSLPPSDLAGMGNLLTRFLLDVVRRKGEVTE